MRRILILSGLLLLHWLPHGAAAQEVTGRIDLETRAFPEGALFDEQHAANLSLSAEPELFLEWAGGRRRLVVTPFARLDLGDPDRTHVDLREAYWHVVAPAWELRAGFARVFWGVTESQHLVDVVNQTDGVENTDGEDKLGQPMVNLTYIAGWGTLDLFVLPLFRERTFPGEDGRLRTPLVVDDDPTLRHERLDLAARWFRTLGAFDVGVAHFWGTSREPRFAQGLDADGRPVLVPRYETIHQTSLDVQATLGGWLWKLEALTRSGQGDRFYALVGGFEYTLANLRGSGADLGLLVEYHHDTRDAVVLDGRRLAATPFDDDVFAGARLALNDVQSTELLAGAVVDLRGGGTALFLETGRRLGSRWTIDVEARGFLRTDPTDPLHSFRRDHYGQIELAYHF